MLNVAAHVDSVGIDAWKPQVFRAQAGEWSEGFLGLGTEVDAQTAFGQ